MKKENCPIEDFRMHRHYKYWEDIFNKRNKQKIPFLRECKKCHEVYKPSGKYQKCCEKCLDKIHKDNGKKTSHRTGSIAIWKNRVKKISINI